MISRVTTLFISNIHLSKIHKAYKEIEIHNFI